MNETIWNYQGDVLALGIMSLVWVDVIEIPRLWESAASESFNEGIDILVKIFVHIIGNYLTDV
jgi:hypothetical protein